MSALTHIFLVWFVFSLCFVRLLLFMCFSALRVTFAAHWYTLRASSCALLPSLCTLLQTDAFRDSIIESLTILCRDDTAMVRRAAAEALKVRVPRNGTCFAPVRTFVVCVCVCVCVQ